MKRVRKIWRRAVAISHGALGLLRVVAAFVLLWKVHAMNDLGDTLAEDPLILWIALGMAAMLISPAMPEGLDEAVDKALRKRDRQTFEHYRDTLDK